MMNKFWFLIIDLLFGFLIGFIFLCFLSKFKYFLYYNAKSSLLNLFSLHKHKITQIEKLCLTNSFDLSRTWMYELRDETYNSHQFSFSMTNLCLIEIQKNILFVFQPSKEPDHRLNDQELYSQVIFNQVRIYNLTKATIGLLPINMIRSKYWSKNSPIVLQNILYLKNEFIQTLSTNISISLNRINKNNVQKTLFLFTRTRRSKEDWFYRFVNASQLDSWRQEICYQLEQDEKTIDTHKQISMTNTLSRKKNVSLIYNDQEHKKRMIEFLERTDRFAAPDQLPYLKSVDVVRKFLSNLKQEKRNKNRKRFLTNKYNREIRSMNNYKQQYCERWLMEQNQMDMINEVKTTKYNLKKSEPNQVRNTNRSKNELSQLSLRTDSNQFQHHTHSLLFFVLKYLRKIPHNTIENNIENPILLLNIFAARCFLDFFDHEQYLEQIKIFLQKQLRKIKIPFVEHITITNLNLGDRLPEIKDIFKPWIDEHGLWSHIKISYDGKLQLTLTAKLKWIRKHRLIDQMSHKNTSLPGPRRTNDFEEKNVEPIVQKYVPVKKSWRKRLWPPTHWFRYRRSISKTPIPNKTNVNIFENTSKQENYSSSYSEKVLPKTSRTTIVIKLEVNNLNGILLFNIPPIPSDRIWISFLDIPEMEFSAIPHLGEYRVPFYRIKDKLEKKLRQTFRRYLVMPNMKDFVIPTVNDYQSDGGFIKVISSEMKVNDQHV